jgi:hypothetical protein
MHTHAAWQGEHAAGRLGTSGGPPSAPLRPKLLRPAYMNGMLLPPPSLSSVLCSDVCHTLMCCTPHKANRGAPCVQQEATPSCLHTPPSARHQKASPTVAASATQHWSFHRCSVLSVLHLFLSHAVAAGSQPLLLSLFKIPLARLSTTRGAHTTELQPTL